MLQLFLYSLLDDMIFIYETEKQTMRKLPTRYDTQTSDFWL